MKFVKLHFRGVLVGFALFALVGISGIGAESEPDETKITPSSDGGQQETTRFIPTWAKWQKDIVQFDAELRKLVETAEIPEKEKLAKRIKSESGWVEVITDGYGGVVDFNAAKGTIQHEANTRLVRSGGPHIDWEFELAGDTKINYDKSTRFVPKIARIANKGEEKNEKFRFFISLAETDDGPYKAGDRIKLRASVDDFSRFKKGYHEAAGLVAIYYLEDSPNPVFDVRLAEAKISLLKSSEGEQGGGADQPATAPESNAEGSKEPKPESDGRSQ